MRVDWGRGLGLGSVLTSEWKMLVLPPSVLIGFSVRRGQWRDLLRRTAVFLRLLPRVGLRNWRAAALLAFGLVGL